MSLHKPGPSRWGHRRRPRYSAAAHAAAVADFMERMRLWSKANYDYQRSVIATNPLLRDTAGSILLQAKISVDNSDFRSEIRSR